ncbi:PDZ and LIM domain protein 3-like, partial [Morphnus guianensis]
TPKQTQLKLPGVNTWGYSRPSPTSTMQAPFASVYNPLQAQTSEPLQWRHSTSSIPSQVRVGPEQLKRVAQVCPNSPVEVEVPGLKVLHVQFNSPLQLYSQSNIMDSLQGQISSVSPDFPR